MLNSLRFPRRWLTLLPLVLALVAGNVRIAEAQASTQEELFALMNTELSDFCDFYADCDSAIEIVNLDRMTTVDTIDLEGCNAGSLAVSPDGQTLYVCCREDAEVLVVDRDSARVVTSIDVTAPTDCVLSHDGGSLYISAGRSIAVADTSTNRIVKMLDTGEDLALGIALSPDGSTIGVVTTQGGTNPAVYLVAAAGDQSSILSREAISNPDEPTNCATSPNDVEFTDAGRMLLWDSNCDNLYQVDVSSETQLVEDTIRLTRGAVSPFNFNNMVRYSAVAGEAYALKVGERELAVMNPEAGTAETLGGFEGVPFVPQLTPDGEFLLISVFHRFSGGGEDTLDAYDTLTGEFARELFTFRTRDMSVRDMQIIQIRVADNHVRIAVPSSANLTEAGGIIVFGEATGTRSFSEACMVNSGFDGDHPTQRVVGVDSTTNPVASVVDAFLEFEVPSGTRLVNLVPLAANCTFDGADYDVFEGEMTVAQNGKTAIVLTPSDSLTEDHEAVITSGAEAYGVSEGVCVTSGKKPVQTKLIGDIDLLPGDRLTEFVEVGYDPATGETIYACWLEY